MQERSIAQDYVTPIGVEQRKSGNRPAVTFSIGQSLTMEMQTGAFSLHGNAISQLAEKIGVPAKYLRKLSEGAP